MSTLKDMTVSEQLNYERIIKMGYTHKEAIQQLQRIRAIPKEDREELIEAIKKNMIIEISNEEYSAMCINKKQGQ